jgi:NH3-dependent NAD+ synthetase
MTDEITIAAVPDMRDRPKRVMLGISGGVDSSVAALLLQQMGAEVIGMTMITNDAGWAAAADAASVCNTLGIEHIIEDVRNDSPIRLLKILYLATQVGKHQIHVLVVILSLNLNFYTNWQKRINATQSRPDIMLVLD